MKKLFLTVLLSSVFLTGCTSSSVPPLFEPSTVISVEAYATFPEYVKKTEQLIADNRYFLSNNQQQELRANLPFEIKPKHPSSPSKGVLLVHGLGDSPFSFIDIANSLAAQGYLVRTVLLAGHGTKPGDMLSVHHEDWESLVSEQAELLKKEVEEVYLGGFSTGGNLVYLQAEKDDEIKGLMLFSPAFKSNEPLAPYVSWLKPFKKWLITGNPDSETNYVRYTAMPTNGFAEYQATSKKAMESLKVNTFDRPVFMVLSEHDSVLDSNRIKKIFNECFTHQQSRLMWFGHQHSGIKGKIHYIDSRVPELRISNMSHMGMLFSSDNPYYGINGTERICRNHNEKGADEDEAYCKAGNPVWYSAWDGQDSMNVHARLTFNPEFELMMSDLAAVFSKKDS